MVHAVSTGRTQGRVNDEREKCIRSSSMEEGENRFHHERKLSSLREGTT